MSAMTRIESLVDEGTFKELNQKLISKNPLSFPGYEKKINNLMEENQINEAVVTGIAKLDGQTVAIGVMDSYFMMASMGSVVGEKVTRLIETATSKKLPLVLVCASGGARMQEGMYSLMQMAKTSAAIAKHNEAGLLYISVLTQPTMGGVTASFATLGDIILAEKGQLLDLQDVELLSKPLNNHYLNIFKQQNFYKKKDLWIKSLIEKS